MQVKSTALGGRHRLQSQFRHHPAGDFGQVKVPARLYFLVCPVGPVLAPRWWIGQEGSVGSCAVVGA